MNPHLPRAKHLVVQQWAGTSPGELYTEEGLGAAIRHARPVASLELGDLAAVLEGARWIGVLSASIRHAPSDGATSVLRAVGEPGDDPERLIAACRATLPAETDQILVQADLTLLAGGLLAPAMQRELELIADVESAGVASMFRVTEGSVRRALDAGRTGNEILAFLSSHALGEVPQAVRYLVEDVARRHGTLRGGPALSYLRCDDPALLLQAADSAQGKAVGLRIITPTVAISQAPLIQVIESLRSGGFQPTAEDPNGAALDLAPDPVRILGPARRRHPGNADAGGDAPKLDDAQVAALVARIRRADAGVAAARRGTTVTDEHGLPLRGGDTLSTLQAAVKGRRTVTLGFVDKQGVAVHRVVKPVTVASGSVDAVDPDTGKVYRYQLHRITEVIE